MKHTPGPWNCSDVSAEGNKVYARISAGRSVIGFAGIYKMPNPAESEANARLIAAAPDLLEQLKMQRCPACKGLIGDPKQHPELDCYCDEARAAIAKATGETK